MNAQELLDKLIELKVSGMNLSDFKVVCTYSGQVSYDREYPKDIVLDQEDEELRLDYC